MFLPGSRACRLGAAARCADRAGSGAQIGRSSAHMGFASAGAGAELGERMAWQAELALVYGT